MRFWNKLSNLGYIAQFWNEATRLTCAFPVVEETIAPECQTLALGDLPSYIEMLYWTVNNPVLEMMYIAHIRTYRYIIYKDTT